MNPSITKATSYQLLDGKKASAEIKQEIAAEVEKIKKEGGKVPHLSAILVGNDGASQTYVAGKVRTCEDLGFRSSLFTYDLSVTEKEILAKIEEINNNAEIDGLIVQLPLPPSFFIFSTSAAISCFISAEAFLPSNSW